MSQLYIEPPSLLSTRVYFAVLTQQSATPETTVRGRTARCCRSHESRIELKFSQVQVWVFDLTVLKGIVNRTRNGPAASRRKWAVKTKFAASGRLFPDSCTFDPLPRPLFRQQEVHFFAKVGPCRAAIGVGKRKVVGAWPWAQRGLQKDG